MDKLYYNADSLDAAIRVFEDEYGMSSQEMHARYVAGESIKAVSRFEQHIWASFFESVQRLTAGAGVERPQVVQRVGRALTCA